MPSGAPIVQSVDAAVVGGGVIGLSAARAIAQRGLSVCVLERHPHAGMDTSTHNSGVIHAGLYHPRDSLKSRLCVQGRHFLYEFCAAHAVPHRRCGKFIVASSVREVGTLEALRNRGEANGVQGLELVDRSFLAAREPHVRGVAALYSPDSGTVDASALVKALLRSSVSEGVAFLPGTPLIGAERSRDGIALRTERETILARQVVNAAGLYSDAVTEMLGGEGFTIYPCRGEYAELVPAKRHLVNALVYPVPDASGHGLGVHLVPTLGGAVWIGPTVRYQDRKDDYEDNRSPIESFLEPVRALLPDVNLDDLRLAGSGVRPKLHPPSESFRDFLIRRDATNPRLVQAAGIDSPGLTASLAVGQLVSDIVAEGV
jgi:L-2-hydroxyglutarate oxidase LhgO